MPTPALPLTISCLLSESNQIVVLSACNSSSERYSWARSQITGGSVTCASQSKVAKSLVIGSNRCTGMGHLRREFSDHPPTYVGQSMGKVNRLRSMQADAR